MPCALAATTDGTGIPYRIDLRPVFQTVKAVARISGTVRANDTSTEFQRGTPSIWWRGAALDFIAPWALAAGKTREFPTSLDLDLPSGTNPACHIFAVRSLDKSGNEGSDCYFVVDFDLP